MTAFYGEQKVDESDTPPEAFSHFKLGTTDTGRGIFLMRYERPNEVEMSELFRPVSPWQTPDLSLTAYEVRQNRAGNAVRVLAFFKEESGRMLLDWDVYTQTKYRTLRHFAIQTPRGHRQVFRVTAQEVPQEGSPTDRLFRFSDPAHDRDHVEIPVRSDTPSGRILAELAFSNSNRHAQARYATVELGWTEEEPPRMVLREVLCWEFLGLGGERGNTNPTGP